MMKWGVAVLVCLTSLYSVNGQSGCINDQITRDNIRYSYHENDCNQYRQCHRDTVKNEYVIVYRSCPFNQYWDQATLECRPQSGVNCPIATCSGTTRHEGNGCRAYWQCVNRVVNATCCDRGYRYTSEGCVPDYTCMDPCPGPCATDHVCRSFPNWDNTNLYFKDGQPKECPGGTHFDVLECGCVQTLTPCNPAYEVDFTNANSILQARNNWLQDQNLQTDGFQAAFQPNTVFQANTRLDPASIDSGLLIRFSFRERTIVGGIRNILQSDDCKRCHQMTIDLVQETFGNAFQVTLRKFNRIASQITLNMQGINNTNWMHVAVYYTGKELLAILRFEGITYMKRTDAPPLNIMDCGFTFGSQAARPFTGFLSNIRVYSCNPSGRSLDLVPTAINDPL